MRRPQRPVSPVSVQSATATADVTESMKNDNDRVAQSGLGAFTDNKEYSIERIFTDLVFYLDTEENARANHLQGTNNQPEDDEE